jgi:NAD(P)-dependent dehydrogenase (short-subunit alcohol dehydrogenase family)
MSQGSLTGKVAMITGATAKRGMGHAIALRLASEGADIIVVDRAKVAPSLFPGDEGWRGLEEEVEEIEALGRKALAVEMDISKTDSVNKGIAAAIAKFGRIDILVNCAAIRGTPNLDLVDGDEKEWQALFDVNSLGPFIISKAVIKHMIKRGEGGKIVHFASVAGRMGAKGNAAYAASKWAVIGLIQSLAFEVAQYKINVNGICPGMIVTNLRDHHMVAGAKKQGISVDEFRQNEYDMVSKAIPMGRIGSVDDISNVVSFLVSSQADYLTGQSINVCGGIHMD